MPAGVPTDASSTADGDRSPFKVWLAVFAVAVGIFSIMTTELLPVGLLTPVGSALNVSDGTAGLMVTVPGIVAAISAPLITVAAGRFDRRLVLSTLLVLLVAANLISALAPSFGVLLAARVLVGLSIGGFWSVAGGLAVRLVPGRSVGRATSVIFGGVAAASVLGVPAGTLIGELGGWRTAFAAVGLLGLAALVCLLFLVPSLPATQTVELRELTGLFRDNTGVLIGVIITFLLITGHFAAYTFVRPILEQVSGIDGSLIGALLLVYGIAGIVGNFVAGSAAAHDVRRTLLVIVLALAAAMLLIPVFGGGQIGGTALLIVWGLAYGGVSVSLQTWMLEASPKTTEAATSLFVATFNLSIALGGLIGGLTLDAVATAGVLWVGSALVLLTAVAVSSSKKMSLA